MYLFTLIFGILYKVARICHGKMRKYRPTLRPTTKTKLRKLPKDCHISEMAKIFARGLGLSVGLSLGFTQVAASASTMSRQSSSSPGGRGRNILENYAWPKAWPYTAKDFRHCSIFYTTNYIFEQQ